MIPALFAVAAALCFAVSQAAGKAAMPRIGLARTLAVLSGGLMLVGHDWLKYAALESLGPVKTASLLLLRLPFSQGLGALCFREQLGARRFIATLLIPAGGFGLVIQG